MKFQLGQLIKEARIKKGIGMSELARLVKVNRATVFRWESGESEITMDNLKKVKDVLDLEIDWNELIK